MSDLTTTKPKVSDPIIFRSQPNGPERVVKPCSGRCRDYWLSGYMVVSCKKCMSTVALLDPPAPPEGGTE